LGDSILFLIRNRKIIPLSPTDNIETSLLQGKISSNQENTNLAALSQYIGGKYAIEDKKYDREINRINLNEGDYIVLASDGVLDGLGNNVFDSQWDKEQILLRKVVNHEDDIKHAVELMIRQGNANGGADNMSIILIKGEAWDE
jgi:serine/threonine protein phosphatase PrpC